MPYRNVSMFSEPSGMGSNIFGGGGDWLSGLGGLATGVADIIGAVRGQRALPGGARGFFGTNLPTIDLPGIDIFQGGGCPTMPFTSAAASGVRAATFGVPHPVTGRWTWFKPAGRPLLWSGDLSACRRVRKIAGRARRRLGGR